MKRLTRIMLIGGALAITAGCGQKKGDFKYLLDEFADLKVMRYTIPGWEELTLQQKEYAYHLAEAAKWGRDIHWDQNCKYNIPIRHVVENILNDIMFCLSGRAVCINLWHGVGLKRIEYNATSGPLADRFKKKNKYDVFTHPECFRKPDWLVTSTPYQTRLFSSAFRIPESRCLETGYPRNRILISPDKVRMQFVENYEPEQTSALIHKLKDYDKVYIYMPTFRDSQLSLFTQSMDLERLNRIMADTNSMLILKPHANVRLTENFSSLTNIMLASPIMDIYPILPYVHVLITDYSSIIYDWLLMEGKDVILYLYDYDAYVRERDFFYPFDENVTGCRVDSFESLCSVIESGDYAIDKEERKRLLERFWGETAQYDSSGMILDFVKGLDKKR